MNKTRKLYHYIESGLDNIYLQNGFKVTESPYGDAVSITDMDGLHRLIGRNLVDKPAPLTGQEFRFLRVELDLSQKMMGRLLGRKERRVRDWETGGKAVPEPANTMIRFFYRERTNPSETYEEFSKAIAELQELDKALFEMRLRSTDHGWEAHDEMIAVNS